MVGLSPDQCTVRYGDLRVRAQELLSPFDGSTSSAKKATSLNDSVLLCSSAGGDNP